MTERVVVGFELLDPCAAQTLLDSVALTTKVHPALMDAETQEFFASCRTRGPCCAVCEKYVHSTEDGSRLCKVSNGKALRTVRRTGKACVSQCDHLGFTEIAVPVRMAGARRIIGLLFSGRILRSERQRERIKKGLERFVKAEALEEARSQIDALTVRTPDEFHDILEVSKRTAEAIGTLCASPMARERLAITNMISGIGPSLASNDAGKALEVVLKAIQDAYGFDRCVASIYRPAETKLVPAAVLGWRRMEAEVRKTLTFKVSKKPLSLTAKAVNDKTAYFAAHPETDPFTNKDAVRTLGIKAPVVVCPMVIGEEILGAILATASHRGTPPDSRAVEQLLPFAQCAATVVASVREMLEHGASAGLPVALRIVTPDRRIVYVNSYQRELFPDTPLVGKKCYELFAEDGLGPCCDCPVDDVLRGDGQAERLVCEALDGQKRWFQTVASVHKRDHHNRVTQIMVVMVDVTEWYVEVSRLVSTGKIVRETFHHVGNKMGAALQILESLDAILPSSLQHRDQFHMCLVSTGVAAQAVDRAREATSGLEMKECGIADRLADTIQAEWTQRTGNVRITLKPNGTIPQVEADWDKLRDWVFDDLFENSAEAEATHIEITVSARSERGPVKIEWVDNGNGFPEWLLDMGADVFDPEKLRRELGDYHYGLAIARAVLLEHGGDMTIDNVPGKGARVAIQLPVGRPQPGATTKT